MLNYFPQVLNIEIEINTVNTMGNNIKHLS